MLSSTSSGFPIIILRNLTRSEEYTRKCLPFLDRRFFLDQPQQLIFDEVDGYFKEYNQLPSKEILLIRLSKRDQLKSVELAKDVISAVKTIFTSENEEDPVLHQKDKHLNWLVDETERWIQERAVYNAVLEAVNILDEKDFQKRDKHAIPKILQDALSISFDADVGLDYIGEFGNRLEAYRENVEKIPFDLDIFNKITNGGVAKKTLSLIMAASGVGKSLILCHFAASFLMQSRNVLYITLEMSETSIAARIDGNLMNIPVNELPICPENVFNDRMGKIIAKTKGRLFIKEYPTAAAHTGHFRALLNELKTKKNFIPDVIVIDYINICASSRYKVMSGGINSYTMIKSVAEEIRGLAVEFNVPVFSATQTNRSGFSNSELDETNISDSIGTVMTVDMLFAAISNDELRDRGQMMIKQIKNRYNDPGFYNKFFIGVDRSRMKLYDLPESVSNAGQSPQQQQTSSRTTDTYDDVLNKTTGWNSDKDDSYDFDGLTF